MYGEDGEIRKGSAATLGEIGFKVQGFGFREIGLPKETNVPMKRLLYLVSGVLSFNGLGRSRLL